ncbi:MAG TPA: prolyl oligopeptidase family serine peptidase, partial [Thermoanaerobaculia bacterium]|nr:prolyl oligopeptidase family serine peptidase [Thermoanaerobaculia bacterium]
LGVLAGLAALAGITSFARLTPASAAAPPAAATAAAAPAATSTSAAGTQGAPATGAPTAAAPPHYTIEQFLATTTWTGAAFSPDGRQLLVSGNGSGVFNAYTIPVAGGAPRQLTDSKVSAIQVLGWFPTGGRILYESDQGGNEQTHLYVRNADGATRDLTPGDKLKAQFEGWAPDDKTFFFSTNERDPHYFDLYEMTVDGYQRTLLFRNEGGFAIGPISRNRRHVALVKQESTGDSDVYLYDRSTAKLADLTTHTGDVANLPQVFSPDGASLYYTTDEGGEFARLVRYDLASGKRADVLRPDWDVSGADFSRDGRFLEVSINRDAATEVRLFAEPGMRPVKLPELPDADITGLRLSRDSRRLAFFAESSRSPRNLYVIDTADLDRGTPRQLTRALNPAIDPDALVASRVERFKSYDGVEVPGLLFQPKAASREHPAPALVWVHGGPGGQSRVGYSALIQFLVNHGYAVYAINNRGSSGYGKTFFHLADRKHGNADLGDCVAAKGMLAATGWVAPDHVGIIGGSYGGYMVLAALAFRPHEFAAGVDLFGVANWVRTLASIPPYWASERKALYKLIGDPQADADYLRKISPLFHAEQIERPLLVLQGENDPRVLRQESDEIVAAARKRGTPVEYLIFPNEGHGFARKETQVKAYQAVLVFLDKYLPQAPAAAAAAGGQPAAAGGEPAAPAPGHR